MTVEVDSFSDCGRITSEAALPIVVADHRYRVLARNFVILSCEGPPRNRPDAQCGKIAARDILPAAGRELRLAVHAHVHRSARQGEDSGEGVTVVSNGFEERIRKTQGVA